MNIYLVERDDGGDFYEYDGFVVWAESKPEALLMAREEHGEEGIEAWADDKVTVTLLAEKVTADKAGIILASFAG